MSYKQRYTEVAKTKVTDKRNLVISRCNGSTGGFTIAQQSPIEEGDNTTYVFFKGAIHIKDLEHLYNVRDCINIAIHKIEQQLEDEKAWDDALNE